MVLLGIGDFTTLHQKISLATSATGRIAKRSVVIAT